jgi:type II secretory pathway component PulF
MPRYRYQATDAGGLRRSGEVEGPDPERASLLLEAEGLRVESLASAEAAGKGPGPGGGLSDRDVAEFTRHVAGLTKEGLALPPGLRAMAEELPRGPLRRVLADVAAELEAGRSLDEAIEAQGGRFPPHVVGLVRAGIRCGRLGEVLADFVRYEQASADLRRRVWLNLAYPIMLATAMTLLAVFVSMVVVVPYSNLYRDFGLQLPLVTQWLIGLASLIDRGGWALIPAPLVVVLCAWAAGRGLLPAPARTRLSHSIPLVGPMTRWTAMAEFCHLLALLLEGEVPLPAALLLAGEGVKDADLALSCRAVSREIEKGRPVAAAFASRRLFQSGFVKILRWAEGHRSIPEALHVMGEIYEARARSQARFVGVFCIVMAAILVFWGLGFVVTGLYLPLVRLITVLSG